MLDFAPRFALAMILFTLSAAAAVMLAPLAHADPPSGSSDPFELEHTPPIPDPPVYAYPSGMGDSLCWIAEDLWGTVTAPLEFDEVDWIGFGIGAGLVVAASQTDRSARHEIKELISNDEDGFLSRTWLKSQVLPWGQVKWVETYEAAGLLISWAFQSPEAMHFFTTSLTSTIMCQAITGWVKGLSHRERPRDSPDSQWQFHGLGDPADLQSTSFPSGDALAAFSWSWIAIDLWPAWISWAPLTIALIVAVERVQLDAHWPSDVLASCLIARAVSMRVMSLSRNRAIELNAGMAAAGTPYAGIGIRF